MPTKHVTPQLAELKRRADEAGQAFRDAKRRCFRSNFEYFFHAQVARAQPSPVIAARITPERARAVASERAAEIGHWDRERAEARAALDGARAHLEHTVAAYRSAKSSVRR
jgi:hypothetical protein